MTIKTDDEESQLQIGIRLGDLSMVRSSLNEGCNPNEAGSHGWTALHEAVSSGSSSITLALLRKGANPNFQESVKNSTPLHVAAANGNAKIIQVLLDSGASITIKNAEGKTPEHLASSSCKELLERKRIELLMRGGTSPGKPQPHSVHKMYAQNRPGISDLNESINNTESLDYNENVQPGPGEIQVSFEFLSRYSELKINILDIRDLKLPPAHNFTGLYVKCYLLPDKYKETKRKTAELRIEMSEGTSSRSSSASSQSSQSSTASSLSISSIGSGKQVTDKLRTVLKKRPHISSKKNKDGVECMLHTVARDTVCRATARIDETLSYKSSSLKKINMAECQIHLSVCGRNRYSAKGIPVADVMIPLAAAIKKQEPEWFSLDYKIDIPVTLCRERKPSQMNRSFEFKEGGYYTGRSLAWDQGLSGESSTDPQQQPDTAFKPPVQPSSSVIKKHHKHSSKTSRFLKGELKLFRGKHQHNSRYNRSMDSISGQDDLGNSMAGSSNAVEYIGQGYKGSHTNLSVPSKTVMDRQINEHFSTSRSWHSSRNINEPRQNNRYDFSNQDEVQVLNPKYENILQGSSEQGRPLMKYSRAFGESARRQRFPEDDVAVEDVEEDFDVCEKPTPVNQPHRPKAYRY